MITTDQTIRNITCAQLQSLHASFHPKAAEGCRTPNSTNAYKMRRLLFVLCICLTPLLMRAENADGEAVAGEVVDLKPNEDGAVEIPIMEIDFGPKHFKTTDIDPNANISVDFPDEDVITIISNVAALYNLNIIIPDTLTGNTSIRLRDVHWRQVYQVVLEPLGYTYREDGNIVYIESIEYSLSWLDYLIIGCLIIAPLSIALNIFLLVRQRRRA